MEQLIYGFLLEFSAYHLCVSGNIVATRPVKFVRQRFTSDKRAKLKKETAKSLNWPASVNKIHSKHYNSTLSDVQY
jgi:hypothetical protein